VRLRAARDFESCRTPQFRASLRWLSLAARSGDLDSDGARVRVGITVGKRMARKSVQRNLVKRVLRDAARHALPALQTSAARRVDVVLRLKAAFPDADRMTLTEFRRALRAEADVLLQRLAAHLSTPVRT
jgi:ribonuclease P protein component